MLINLITFPKYKMAARWYQIALMTIAAAFSGCKVENPKARPFIEPALDIQYTWTNIQLTNVPEHLRTVPIHPEDIWYAKEKNNGPILNDYSKLPNYYEIRFLKGGLEIMLNEDTYLDVYGDLSYLTTSHPKDHRDVHVRNYTNHPGTGQRGTGAALTYWTGNFDKGIFVGLKADVHKALSDEHDMFIGIGHRKLPIGAETGWDRFNSLEKHKLKNIGEIGETSIYWGIGSSRKKESKWTGEIRMGVSIFDLSNIKHGITADGRAAFFLAGQIGYRF